MHLNELSKEIAYYTNSQESDVVFRSRILRKNGIIDQGGYGPSARNVNLEDAINLLLAVLINEKASDVHIRTAKTGQLKINPIRQTISTDPLLSLDAIKDRSLVSITLFECLMVIIRDISSKKFQLPLIKRLIITYKQLDNDSNLDLHTRVTIDYFNDRQKFTQNVTFKNFESLKEISDDTELLEHVDTKGNFTVPKYLQSNFGDSIEELNKKEKDLNYFENKFEGLERYRKIHKVSMSNDNFSTQELESIPIIEKQYKIGGQIFFILASLFEENKETYSENISYSMASANDTSEKISNEIHYEDIILEIRKQSQNIKKVYSEKEGKGEVFEKKQKYNYENISNAMGSRQTQAGVLWGEKDNNVIACLARGKEFTDQKLPDGSWYYFGQGAKGDQSWNFANQLIRDKQIYLFNNLGPSAIDKNRKRKKNRYEYIGLFFCDHWEYIISKDKNREGDKMIRFHLVPQK